MEYTYEVMVDEITKSEILKRTDKNGVIAWVPTDLTNADYQAYLNPDKVEHLTEIVPGE